MDKKSDLIDRNELYNQIRLYLNRHSLGETAVWTTLTIGEIASIIANISTVEAEPVRHGKWIPIIDEYGTRSMLTGYKCSLCGRCEEKEEPYCHCGAKMGGE